MTTRHPVRVSFEVFPPRSDDALAKLGAAVSQLGAVDPTFVSVTYGAGGSSSERSFAAIDTVRATGVEIAAHLTCVGQPIEALQDVIERYQQLGVSRIVALRGDPPEGIDAPFVAHPRGFQRTADLVAAVADRFAVAVAAYPEVHPQSLSLGHDLDVLEEKVGAGATLAMTQMFFDNRHFFRYRDAVAARGIDVEIVPGIFPIYSYDAVARFAARCGASMPAALAERFTALGDDADGARDLAADTAAAQITELVAEGVRQVHLYTLNRAQLALAVCERLGAIGV